MMGEVKVAVNGTRQGFNLQIEGGDSQARLEAFKGAALLITSLPDDVVEIEREKTARVTTGDRARSAISIAVSRDKMYTWFALGMMAIALAFLFTSCGGKKNENSYRHGIQRISVV